MNWAELLKPIDGSDKDFTETSRSRFEKDYDRLIYSTAFRRLQMKTQVYPLSGLTMVHNRLTHTLEVASVGRSLVRELYNFLKTKESDFCKNYPGNMGDDLKRRCSDSLLTDLQAIVMSACLAHDMGNPPFGHFGEKAIRYFFESNVFLWDSSSTYSLTDQQKADLLTFDGNANVFRMLTFPYSNKGKYGFCVSYPTLATIIKYPWDSLTAIDLGKNGKFGFFQNEQDKFKKIVESLGLVEKGNATGKIRYARHPLVFLMEAADDICNFFVDLQDGEHIKLITAQEIWKCLEDLLATRKNFSDIKESFSTLREIDSRDAVLALRTHVYDVLVNYCISNFKENYDAIMDGTHLTPLIEGKDTVIEGTIQKIKNLKQNKLFSDRKVLQLELAGFDVITHLLERFFYALLAKLREKQTRDELNIQQKHLIELLPIQFRDPQNEYEAMLFATDFVSYMTDEYALDLRRKISGQKIPELY